MDKPTMNRRTMIANTGLLMGSFVAFGSAPAHKKHGISAEHQFTFCLNTSTIREKKLGLVEEIETAARAGFDGIEVWTRDVESYQTSGGNLKEIQQRAKDLGIKIESAIGFPQWIVDDPVVRSTALEQARWEMDMLAQIGCLRMAAPPVGATNEPGLDLLKAAERYAALLEIGDQTGVLPQLELWGFSANLKRLGEVMFVAAESGHPKACILPDVYHIYKGGSDFNGLKVLDGAALHMFHVNDYPANPPRNEINDADRVYPGDGVAPLDQILFELYRKNKPIVLSLELFNKDYWKEDPLAVAKTGLKKMKNAVNSALHR